MFLRRAAAPPRCSLRFYVVCCAAHLARLFPDAVAFTVGVGYALWVSKLSVRRGSVSNRVFAPFVMVYVNFSYEILILSYFLFANSYEILTRF